MWKKAERFLAKDKYIGPLIKKYGPCEIRPSKKGEYFFDLVEAIVSQQLSGKAAATIFERVKKGLDGEVVPAKVLATKKIKFRKWGLSRQKTSYLKDLAQRVERGEIKIKKLDKLSDEEIIKELVLVKGIGRWTAEMFLMFSLARKDIFPVDDLGIQKGISKLFKKELKAQEVGKFSQRWSPFRTAASWYIWKVLD